MKKNNMTKTLLLLVIALGMNASALLAQVKIGDNPNQVKESSLLELESTERGFLPPRMTTDQRTAIKNPVEGLVIYNTTKRCFEGYYGIENEISVWKCLTGAFDNNVQGLVVTPIGFTGPYFPGVAMTSENTVKFRLKNNTYTAVTNLDLSDAVTVKNGVSGITVSTSDNHNISLAVGEDTILTYQITSLPVPGATPVSGTLTAYFDKFGMQTDQSIWVGKGTASVMNKTEYVLSLTYNGTEVEGKINNTSDVLVVEIPYIDGRGSHYAINQTQKTALGEGGDTDSLILNIPAGVFNVKGSLKATITVKNNGEYLVKKLAPGDEYIIAEFPIMDTINNIACDIVIKAVGGISDREFGDGKHDFIYFPVTGEDGRIWLNNNLGADYANVNHSAFNLLQQAITYDDYHAYGSKYQWGRYSDGHELIQWTGRINGTPSDTNVASCTNTDTPDTSVFYKYGNSATQQHNWWDNGQSAPNAGEDSLWQGVAGVNNPCPVGYRLPTDDEWTSYVNAARVANYRDAISSHLKITLPGYRHRDGKKLSGVGTHGHYWTSTTINYRVRNRFFYSDATNRDWQTRWNAFPVRCIKD